MVKVINCIGYLILIGIGNFFIGRLIPKKYLHWECFPWKSYAFEREGKIYEKLKIKSWQNHVPDMSKVFYKIMPKKALPKQLDSETLKIMLQETCMAELIHALLAFLSLGCMLIWKGVGGIIIAIAAFLGNVVFVIIQRYNRPRLIKLLNRADRQAKRRI